MSFSRSSLCLVSFLAVPFAIFAQETATPPPAKPAVEAPAGGAPAVEAGTPAAPDASATVNITIPGNENGGDSKTEEVKVVVDFPLGPVKDIIRNTAELFGLNVVVPEEPAMNQKLEFKAKEVTWKQIFKAVLEQVKYTYVEEDGLIKIRSRDQVDLEPLELYTIKVDHTPAAEMAKTLDPIIRATPGAQIMVDNRRGIIILNTRKEAFRKVQSLVEQLDQPAKQVMIESKFVEVSNRDTEQLGLDWSSLGGYAVSAGPFSRTDNRNTSANSSGNAGNTLNSSGASSTNTALGGATTGSVASASGNSLSGALTNNFANGNTRAETAVFNAAQFQVILNALETNRNTKLVSNPTVVALNGTAASINIGEEYPIPNYNYNQERGVFEVSDFEYKPIGILLKVTPQVNRLGFINLEIEPEVSSRSDEKVNFGGAASANIPIINTRKTKSSISIKNSYTLAIGGLVERNTGQNETKVPLLGDLPLVGRLFTTKRTEDSVRNLIIFITAKTLTEDGSTYKEVFSPQQLYQMGVSDADAPGYLAPKEQQDSYDKVLQTRDRMTNEQVMGKLKAEQKALESKEAANAAKLKKEQEAAEKKAAAAKAKQDAAAAKAAVPAQETQPATPVPVTAPAPSTSAPATIPPSAAPAAAPATTEPSSPDKPIGF